MRSTSFATGSSLARCLRGATTIGIERFGGTPTPPWVSFGLTSNQKKWNPAGLCFRRVQSIRNFDPGGGAIEKQRGIRGHYPEFGSSLYEDAMFLMAMRSEQLVEVTHPNKAIWFFKWGFYPLIKINRRDYTDAAYLLFDEIPVREAFSWNV